MSIPSMQRGTSAQSRGMPIMSAEAGSLRVVKARLIRIRYTRIRQGPTFMFRIWGKTR